MCWSHLQYISQTDENDTSIFESNTAFALTQLSQLYLNQVKFNQSNAFDLLDGPIDLLAILQKSLDRALFLYIFIHEIRSSGVGASITIVHIRKFYKM